MTIDLRGELTSPDADALSRAYREATERGARSIVINFADVDLMTSAGISLLIAVLGETRKASQRLIFAGLTAHQRKILTMMGFNRHVELCDTVADAYLATERNA
jgi:anti-anti-sigma factor